MRAACSRVTRNANPDLVKETHVLFCIACFWFFALRQGTACECDELSPWVAWRAVPILTLSYSNHR